MGRGRNKVRLWSKVGPAVATSTAPTTKNREELQKYFQRRQRMQKSGKHGKQRGGVVFTAAAVISGLALLARIAFSVARVARVGMAAARVARFATTVNRVRKSVQTAQAVLRKIGRARKALESAKTKKSLRSAMKKVKKVVTRQEADDITDRGRLFDEEGRRRGGGGRGGRGRPSPHIQRISAAEFKDGSWKRKIPTRTRAVKLLRSRRF